MLDELYEKVGLLDHLTRGGVSTARGVHALNGLALLELGGGSGLR